MSADEITTLKARAEKAEAERDALLLEKAEWERASDAWVQEAHRFANAPVVAERDALKEELDLMFRVRDSMMAEAAESKTERDALRAQVEAARTYARQALDYGEDCDATDLLTAMDGAKP